MIRKIFPEFVTGPGAAALLLMRLVTGCAFMLHGWGKIQNPLAWMGPDSPVPAVFQLLAATAEFFGGMGLVVGFLTPIAAFGILATMTVAFFMVHLPMGSSFVGKPGENSWELVAVFFSQSLLLMLVGPGKLSLDWLVFGSSTLRQLFSRGPRLT